MIVVLWINNSISINDNGAKKPIASINRPIVRDISGKHVHDFKYLPEWMYRNAVYVAHTNIALLKSTGSVSENGSVRIASRSLAIPAPVSTLTIRSYPAMPAGSSDENTLNIRCRTYAPVSNLESDRVTVHGVVTEDVVSATGKILIMAGSKVVGPALIDPENRRLKSDFSYWSIFVDETEIKVQARLLEEMGGLSGIEGKQVPAENVDHQPPATVSDRYNMFFPEASPFCLEVKGEFSLRDVKAERTQKDIL
ncbi:MAG: hypothetical protein JO076_06085 [Verrucomicrobia bacterium]|nr:hypothetical protein [Verrucomicrobiota bacterium]